MIETDVFGCSAKLPFAETEALAAAGDGGDFSILRCDGELATSIDRVHRCARDWGRFARIALNHAFGDVDIQPSAAITASPTAVADALPPRSAARCPVSSSPDTPHSILSANPASTRAHHPP